MSFNVYNAVPAPHTTGMVEGPDPADSNQYQYLCYQNPEGPCWFAATRTRPGRDLGNGRGYIHYLESAFKLEELPPKYDWEVCAISPGEYLRLYRLEVQWWIWHDKRYLELLTAWGEANHPGTAINELPPAPEEMDHQAARFAHWLVAIRENLVDWLEPGYIERC